MLNWYKKLYVGDNAKKKKRQIIRKINGGAGVLDVYLITLAINPADQLEIFSANELLFKSRRARTPLIIGLCKGRQEALEMVEMLAKKVYEETGTGQIRKWLEERIEKEDGR